MLRYLAGTLAAATLLAPVVAVTAAAPAEAASRFWTCTAETWGGDALAPVTVEAKYGEVQAKGLAKTEWRGNAKFSTIECTQN